MKASELIRENINDYILKNHPDMGVKDSYTITETIRNFYKKPVINDLCELFQKFLPEIEFDRINLEKMKRSNDFLKDFSNKYCNGEVGIDFWEKLIFHYNLSVKERENFLNKVGHLSVIDVYETFKKHIDKNLIRVEKLKRILK